MAEFEEANYNNNIIVLNTMFGETVSLDVITSVIESCNGDINQAADAIINLANEPKSTNIGGAAIMNFDNEPTSPQAKSAALALADPEADTNTNFQNVKTLSQFEPLVKEDIHYSNDASVQAIQAATYAQEQTPISANIISQEVQASVQAIPAATYAQEQTPISANQISQEVEALSASLSQAFRYTGAIPRTITDSRSTTHRAQYNINAWPDQITKILTYHNKGIRSLILMRGASGSGKTYLARQIVDYTVGASSDNYAKHIFSTDSYFMRRGVYQFDRNCLSEAHMINQKKVCDAANKGLSPIIVDNTNTEIWEMEPYVRDCVRNGYVIELVEPNTNWARNANQLSRRNCHNVPKENIVRMLDRYENVTPDSLLKILKLSYPASKKPPCKRNIPAFIPNELPGKKYEKMPLKIVKYDNDQTCSEASDSNLNIMHFKSPDSPNGQSENIETNSCTSKGIDGVSSNDDSVPGDELKLQRIMEAQKEFEVFKKLEQEWDAGDSWDIQAKNTKKSQNESMTSIPKPPRYISESEKLLESTSICDDWSKISMFMSPWQEDNSSKSFSFGNPKPVETKDESTCVEVGDLKNCNFKTVYTQSRNITEGISLTSNQIKRLKIMLDKSTSTHDNDMLVIAPECEHKELHFKAFSRMFKDAPPHQLREIFDNCKSDVNWAVNLILDDYPEWIRNTNENDDASDTEAEPIECQCLAAYNIIPDATPSALISTVPEKNIQISTPLSQKKTKRDVKISESSLQLKRQIEHNVIISDNHYSQHYLNLRRRREHDTNAQKGTTDLPLPDTKPEDTVQGATALPEASTYSNDTKNIVKPSLSQYNFQFIDPNESDTESDSNKSDSHDQLVNVNLGTEFLNKLDELFGREGIRYPGNIQPTVSLPMSILRQINAHWAVSVASQMDDNTEQTEEMIKQDEDFARELAAKEEEMSKQGQEPDVPTLKEIMDMELAYSIYERNVAEWRNNEPQDLAAKLSREKLYNLFPNLSKDVLSEMLMAHDYSFKATVESLLISTGQASWLEDEKGVEKFVMNKEMERKEKFLEEETKNLSEVEWPFLTDPEKPVSLETVTYYRSEAQRYLQCRNANFEKARHYFARNSPAAASFYSEIAALHTKKYEHSSCLAAAYLMNYHLRNNPDKNVLDLHFLHVPEAMVNLDLFLDQIILKLRNKNIRAKDIWIITGKGTHSVGGPRIKPAAKRRLMTRDIAFKLVNGGLIGAVLYPTNKMTNELVESENI